VATYFRNAWQLSPEIRNCRTCSPEESEAILKELGSGVPPTMPKTKVSSVPADEAPRLMSVRQIATKFGVTERTIWRLVSAGELPKPFEIGRVRRWDPADIDDYLHRNGGKS
jgi:excisionase family DNA binding protein